MADVINKISGTEKILVLIILFAFLLQVYGLDSKSLWYDEVSSIRGAEATDLSDFLFKSQKIVVYNPPYNYSSNPVFPPAYFYILKAFISFFGSSEFSVRFLSVIFGVLSIPLVFRLGKDLFDERVGLLSSLLLAMMPILIKNSQMVRMYTLLMLTALLSFYFFYKALKKDANKYWILYSLFTIFAFYVHYFTIFLFIGEMTLFVLNFSGQKKIFHKKLIISITTIFVLLLPQIFKVLEFLQYNYTASGIMRASAAPMFYNYDGLDLLRSLEPSYSIFDVNLAVLYISVCIFASYLLTAKERRKKILGVSTVVVPVLLLTIYSLFSRIYEQYFFFILPFFLIFVAKGMLSFRKKRLSAISLIIVIFLNSLGLYVYYTTPNHDYRSAASFLESVDENELVVVEPSVVTAPFGYYSNRTIIGVDENDWSSPVKLQNMYSTTDKFWYIYNFHLEWRDSEKRIKTWLDENCKLEKQFYSLSFYFCAH